MKFDGEFVVDGAPAEIWPYFNDPDILQDCAPGCKEMVLESPSQLRTTLEVGVGSVKPTFDVDAVVLECTKPDRLEIRASGEASRNSFSMTAWQELTDNGDGTTTVEWEADADVSGVIASLGDRALGSVTDKLVNDFFRDLEGHVNAGTPAEAKLEAAGEEELEAAAEAVASHDGDVLDDLFALLGSVRGGGETADDASGNVAVSLAAGAVGGVAGALVWSRLRSGDGATAPPADSDEVSGGGGGRLRYLLVGVVLGAVGTALWNEYAGEATEETPDEEQVTEADSGADPGSEGTAVGAEAGVEPVPGDDGAEPERGLIDDPLDRLN